MPSYPTSVKSFTTKLAGDSILAAHVNDLQDEVNAIEGGIINGTAHVQSSNSTVNALQVTAGSTFAGDVTMTGKLQSSNSTVTNLSVTGGSTLGTLQVAASTFSIRPVLPPPEAVLAFAESTGSIGSSASSTIAFTGEAFQTNNSSQHSTGTNPERFVPQSTGVYQFSAQVQLSSQATGFRSLLIEDSSGADLAIGLQSGAHNDVHRINVTGYKRFDVTGGFVTCVVSNSASTISLSSGVTRTWATMVKL